MKLAEQGMARFARHVLKHRGLVVLMWLAIVGGAAVVANGLPGVLQGGADPTPGSEAELVTRAIERAFGRGAYYQTPIVIHGPFPTSDPRWGAAMASTSEALRSSGHVRRVRTFWSSGDRALLGRDGRSALSVVTPDVGSFSEAEVLTGKLREVLVKGLPPGFTAEVTGTTATLHDLDQSASSDLAAAERIGLPLTLLILLVVFQAPLAAVMPLVLALGSVIVCNAALFVLSRWMPVSVFAENTVTMIGLGVGVDYALFILSRFRRELTEGRSADEAAARTVEAVGGAVLFSGATVAVGFLALFLVNAPFLHAIAIGGMCVVGTAVAASLTLLPALLSRFAPAILWPARRRAPRTAGRQGPWARWAHLVMAHPWISLATGFAVVVALMLPVFGLRSWNVDAGSLPEGTESRRGFEALRASYSVGWMGPVVLLFEAPEGQSVWSPASREAVLATAARLARDARVDAVVGYSTVAEALRPLGPRAVDPAALPGPLRDAAAEVVSPDGRLALVALFPSFDPASRDAARHVTELRRAGFEEARRAGLTVHVGGPAAGFVDFDRELFGSLPRVVMAVLALTFIVLLVMFRSLVIPLKATLLNLASVLASYGFLVLVFQHGVGAGLIGLDPPGGLNSFVVLMLFTILFGLSMDYEVFLLSRIREIYDETGDTRVAVARGLEETAGTISSAALIMVSIFAAFAFTRLIATREFGLGLAFAVALDATIVRIVLVPALMVLAGPLNWWLPRWLGGRPRMPERPAPAIARAP